MCEHVINSKQQPKSAKIQIRITSDFAFLSSNPVINHKKIEIGLTIHGEYKYFTRRYKQLKTNGKSFIVALCRLP